MIARAGQRQRRGAADAARGASDERDAVGRRGGGHAQISRSLVTGAVVGHSKSTRVLVGCGACDGPRLLWIFWRVAANGRPSFAALMGLPDLKIKSKKPVARRGRSSASKIAEGAGAVAEGAAS